MIPKRFTEDVQQEVVASYQAGREVKDLAKCYGTKRETIGEILKAHGITLERNRNKFSLDTELEIATRYADREATSTLAEEFGCAVFTIRDIARRHGVPIYPRGNRYRAFTSQEIAEMARMWEEGMSQHAIGERLGIHQVIVSRVLRSAGYSNEKRTRRGPNSNLWKGGRIRHPSGYWQVLVSPDSPYASMRNRQGYVLEHRLVMAQQLGRPLASHETVHHKNGDRKDNRLENLQLRQGKHGNGVTMRCKDCGSHNVEVVEIEDG